MLRPALCLAVGRALGVPTQLLLPTAAVLEMYHSAFLIHDDIEDDAEQRRGMPTMHQMHGTPIAIHLGDAMLATALHPLLDNMEILGLGPSLAVLEEVARMARETAEGQMMELRLARSGRWDIAEATYLRLVHKKTSWYSFIAPFRSAALIARSEPSILRSFFRLGTLLGAAFQIRDDVLSLSGEIQETGKDGNGDLWEGKHTLILAHALRTAPAAERERASCVLRQRRASPEERCIDQLLRSGELSSAGADRLRHLYARREGPARGLENVEMLRALIDRQGSLEYAQSVASRYARGAQRVLESISPCLRSGPDRQFLEYLVNFVGERRA